jgi:hypothetical protein
VVLPTSSGGPSSAFVRFECGGGRSIGDLLGFVVKWGIRIG